MSKILNVLLLIGMLSVVYFWRQDVTRLEFSVLQAEKSTVAMRLDMEKARDESNLLVAVVLANISKHSEPVSEPVPALNKVCTVTAYSPVELIQQPGEQLFTANMSKPKEGMVAVSRDLFKHGWVFGKKVYIKNHGIFTITDLMGQSKSKSVDIFMDDQGRALQFGRKQIEVVLLDV